MFLYRKKNKRYNRGALVDAERDTQYNTDRRWQNRLLFCKRTKEPCKGLYNFVGGKAERGEDPLDAAYFLWKKAFQRGERTENAARPEWKQEIDEGKRKDKGYETCEKMDAVRADGSAGF